MDSEQARFAASGMQVGAHIVMKIFGLELTEEKCDEFELLLKEVADGSETLSGSTAEMKKINPKINEEVRAKLEEQVRTTAKMIIWWHRNARL